MHATSEDTAPVGDLHPTPQQVKVLNIDTDEMKGNHSVWIKMPAAIRMMLYCNKIKDGFNVLRYAATKISDTVLKVYTLQI